MKKNSKPIPMKDYEVIKREIYESTIFGKAQRKVERAVKRILSFLFGDELIVKKEGVDKTKDKDNKLKMQEVPVQKTIALDFYFDTFLLLYYTFFVKLIAILGKYKQYSLIKYFNKLYKPYKLKLYIYDRLNSVEQIYQSIPGELVNLHVDANLRFILILLKHTGKLKFKKKNFNLKLPLQQPYTDFLLEGFINFQYSQFNKLSSSVLKRINAYRGIVRSLEVNGGKVSLTTKFKLYKKFFFVKVFSAINTDVLAWYNHLKETTLKPELDSAIEINKNKNIENFQKNSNESRVVKRVLTLEERILLKKLYNNPFVQYSMSDIFFPKKFISVVYGNKFFDIFESYMLKSFFSYDLFKNDITRIFSGYVSKYKRITPMDIEEVTNDIVYNKFGFDELEDIPDATRRRRAQRLIDETLADQKRKGNFSVKGTVYNSVLQDYLDYYDCSLFEVNNYSNEADLSIFASDVDSFLYISTLFYDVSLSFEVRLLANLMYDDSRLDSERDGISKLRKAGRTEHYYGRVSYYSRRFPRRQATRDKIIAPLSHYFFFTALNLDDFICYNFRYFDELPTMVNNDLNSYILPFLTKIGVYLSLNRYVYKPIVDLVEMHKLSPYEYINTLTNLQTTNLWDLYFFYLFENMHDQTYENIYIKNKIGMLQEYLHADFQYRLTPHYKYENINLYQLNEYTDDYFSSIYSHKTTQRAIMDNYTTLFDLQFYVDYTRLHRSALMIDFEINVYTDVEERFKFENLKNNKLINKRFLKYLRNNLYPIFNESRKRKSKSNIYFLDDFTLTKNEMDLDIPRKYLFPHAWDLEPPTLIPQLRYKPYREERVDPSVYDYLLVQPFTMTKANMHNVLEYAGYQHIPNYPFLHSNFFLLYFDYYVYSMKMFLLDYILVHEYGVFLPKQLVIGPSREHLISYKYMDYWQKIQFVFNKWSNFFLNLESFDDYFFFYKDRKIYYGYTLQLPFFIFFYIMKNIIATINLLKVLWMDTPVVSDHRKTVNFFFSLLELFDLSRLPFDASSTVGLFWTYDLDDNLRYHSDSVTLSVDLEEFDGYTDPFHDTTSDVYESLGFNGILADIDNRYYLNHPELSQLYIETSAKHLHWYILLTFFRDICVLLFIQSCVTYYYFYKNNVEWILKFFKESVLNTLELSLYLIFLPIYVSILSIYYLFVTILNYNTIFCEFLIEVLKKLKIFHILFFIHMIFLLPFEILRIFFVCIYNLCVKFIIKYIGLSKLIYINNILLNLVYNIVKYTLIFMIKLLLIYVLLIGLFDYYDAIILFIERIVPVRFSYRTYFVFYSIVIFMIFIFLLNPLKLGKSLWEFRIYFLFLVATAWVCAGLVNSPDILFSDLWGAELNRARQVFYGPDLYIKHIQYTNYDTMWANKVNGLIESSWYNNSIATYYRSATIKLQSFAFLITNQIYPLYYAAYSPYFRLFMNTYNAIYEVVAAVPFYDLFITNVEIIQENLLPYMSADFKEFMKLLKEIEESESINQLRRYHFYVQPFGGFFGYYYSIFSMHFLSLNWLAALNSEILSSEMLGWVYAHNSIKTTYKPVRHRSRTKQRVYRKTQLFLGRLRLLYYRHMFSTLRKDMWGQHKISPNCFFMFYRRGAITDNVLPYHEPARAENYTQVNFNNYSLTLKNHVDQSAATRLFNPGFPVVDEKALSDSLGLRYGPHRRVDLAESRVKRPPLYFQLLHKSYVFNLRGHFWNQKPDRLRIYNTQWLVPDVGFIGSSHWATHWRYLVSDRRIKNDSVFLYNPNRLMQFEGIS